MLSILIAAGGFLVAGPHPHTRQIDRKIGIILVSMYTSVLDYYNTVAGKKVIFFNRIFY